MPTQAGRPPRAKPASRHSNTQPVTAHSFAALPQPPPGPNSPPPEPPATGSLPPLFPAARPPAKIIGTVALGDDATTCRRADTAALPASCLSLTNACERRRRLRRSRERPLSSYINLGLP